MPNLQIKFAGQWRNAVQFHLDAFEATIAAVNSLLAALRIDPLLAEPRVLFEDGRVLSVEEVASLGGWLPITHAEPVPLHDVIVTAKFDAESEPLTFLAYRKAPGDEMFYISGTDERLPGAYAWRHPAKAAPISMMANSP